MKRTTIGIAVACGLIACCCGGPASYYMGGLGDQTTTQRALGGCGVSGQIVNMGGALAKVGGLDDAQTHNAATIIRVGQQMKVPVRGWVIALATALQESRLNNVGDLGKANDHDSLGLFQQRPSQGWGTPDQIMDPTYSSTKFYEHLLQVAGWDTMALTDAAQSVQRSAFPDAYAKHEPLAATIVNTLAGGAALAVGTMGALRCASATDVTASGWTVPVVASIVSPFGMRGGVLHAGVDLGVPKNTPIHAAASGVVMTVRCNVSAGDCDHDGSPAIKGCGWYVDIEHVGGIITRYCHQLRQPDVHPGQAVKAGDVIGVSGTSGNSSGPHLHFEVHRNGDASSNGAVDPVDFMAKQGAPLGKAS